jgi:hypothetical protein
LREEGKEETKRFGLERVGTEEVAEFGDERRVEGGSVVAGCKESRA